jgi:single-strand DNA-binding protein
MASFNKVLLMGNLTRDPEVRVTPNGLHIAKLGLAVNRRFKTKEGETREEVVYVDVDAFGTQAETIQRYCQKGRALFIEGRLRLDQWTDPKTQENRSKLGVVLENFQFIGTPGAGGAGGAPARDTADGADSAAASRGSAAAGSASAATGDDLHDDVPF